MNKFSQVVLAVALSTGTAQAKPIPDNQRDHKAQTTSVTNNQDCAEQ